MCGLVGVIFKEQERTAEQYEKIGQVYTEILVNAQSRGGQATGTATIERDKKYRLIKAPMDATEFVADGGYKDHVAKLSDKASAIIGHTRLSTGASQTFNKNNHPIVAGTVVGTHNGHIRNHRELFDKFEMNRFAQVDSEVIFRMFATAKSPEDFFKNRFPKMEGRASVVFSDYAIPHLIYVVKGNNPLTVYLDKDNGIMIYGSTEEILEPVKKAFNVVKIKLDEMTMMRVNTKTLKVIRRKVKFDAKELKSINDSGAKTTKPSWSYSGGRWWNKTNGVSPATKSFLNLDTKVEKKPRKKPTTRFKTSISQSMFSGLLNCVCHSCGVSAEARSVKIFKDQYCKCEKGGRQYA